MNEYPSAFLGRTHTLLGDEYADFLKCMEQPSTRGIRLNSIKCDEKTLENALNLPIEISPSSPHSYYILEDTDRPDSIPLHHAEAFYSQESSVASAVTILSPQPGGRILDLCAAPSGKSTQTAALLADRGLPWSNEVVHSLAMALLSDLEHMGVSNAVVSSCHPELLCETLSGLLDYVLVDAPCLGEEMFRRGAQAVQDWSEEHVKTCAVRQGLILDDATDTLQENGTLVYSTCTFSPEESEGTVRAFLFRHPDFILEDSGVSFGRSGIGIPRARRVFPMGGGDGHFVAKMGKTSSAACRAADYPFAKFPAEADTEVLYGQIFNTPPSCPLVQNGSSILTAPEFLPGLSGLGAICIGVILDEIQKGRIRPAHALFLSSLPHQLRQTVDFSSRSSEIRVYLYGEKLEVNPTLKGYAGVVVDSMMTGFSRCSPDKMKNRCPKSLHSHT